MAWGPRLQSYSLACVETDSQAALYTVAKFSNNVPTMNMLAAEVGLRVVGHEIDLCHISGVSNYEADALSRLFQGKEVPSHLRHVERTRAPVRCKEFFLAWPRELV